ncbi:MAG: hypothetical protein RIA63_10710, partial [Cyclobacteriaceae bacterium]
MKGFLIFIFFLLAAAISPHGPENQIFDARKIKVLYVGNSLTYSNDLPGLVEELGRMQGVRIQSKVIAKPNYALEDHWLEGTIQSEIKNNHYDFVVAQQGPSALPESQVMLLESAVRFAELCKETKTVFALYMVWPSKSRSFDHDNVIYSYSNTAKKTASLLCPAGLAWKYAWEEDPNLPLYGNDNFHPSIMG